MDRRLQKIKQQLVREASLTQEQITTIEQKAAASVREF